MYLYYARVNRSDWARSDRVSFGQLGDGSLERDPADHEAGITIVPSWIRKIISLVITVEIDDGVSAFVYRASPKLLQRGEGHPLARFCVALVDGIGPEDRRGRTAKDRDAADIRSFAGTTAAGIPLSFF